LLTKKFDEFSNLLAKNNTEALVAVMKSATQEFNKQMSEIVSRLVQENFSELNKSVQQMNSWQKDNKEMIGTLTNQFNQATKNIETTSLQLKDISEKTQSLVADNGKLSEIIKALREVMVDDKKYQSLVNQLTSVVDKLEKNTEQWDETTNKLNSWIVKQRNFNDSIAILMNKLEHVEKVKDINESFWNNTKAQMNEGVGIIKNANQQLANDLETINGQFVEQLNTTLTSLDTLIQRIIQQYE
jgi:DNA repair ATPase RecN